MDECKVGLIWITPFRSDYAQGLLSSDYHLGCGYLQAFLNQNGIASKQYVVESISPEEFATFITKEGIKVLGFSCTDTNYYAVRWVATCMKALNPSLLNVVGGLSATFSDNLLLEQCPAIDLCVRGYGETSFLSVVNAYLSGQNWTETAGITYRTLDGVSCNPEQKIDIGNGLDYFPSPYLSGILSGEMGLKVGISTSRGCTFRCTFCNPTAMAGYIYAYHSYDRVLNEIEFIDSALHRSGMRGKRIMLLNEDCFAFDLSRTKTLCDLLSKMPLKHIAFGCETRIEHLTEEILSSMYSAGFRFLKFGLESASPRVLNLIKKLRTTDGTEDGFAIERDFLEKVANVVLLAKAIGFRVIAGAVFGLPGESLANAIETLDFLRRIDVDEYYHNVLQIFPGTEIFRTYKQWGYKLEMCDGFYPSIYRTYWPYPVELVPRLTEKLNHSFRNNVVYF